MNSVSDSKHRYLALMLILQIVLTTAAGAVEYESRRDHKEYDFHYDIRYPGRLRSDVGRDKVMEKNSKDLKSYNRRVVEWWPKRGIDFTPLEDIPGAPLRTWTPRVLSDSYYNSKRPHRGLAGRGRSRPRRHRPSPSHAAAG
jgi:hypothetical protein